MKMTKLALNAMKNFSSNAVAVKEAKKTEGKIYASYTNREVNNQARLAYYYPTK